MDNKLRRRRPMTQREKELRQLPVCLYDPFNYAICRNHEFPPDKEACKRCLLEVIQDGLSDDEPSESMLGLVMFVKMVESKKNE